MKAMLDVNKSRGEINSQKTFKVMRGLVSEGTLDMIRRRCLLIGFVAKMLDYFQARIEDVSIDMQDDQEKFCLYEGTENRFRIIVDPKLIPFIASFSENLMPGSLKGMKRFTGITSRVKRGVREERAANDLWPGLIVISSTDLRSLKGGSR